MKIKNNNENDSMIDSTIDNEEIDSTIDNEEEFWKNLVEVGPPFIVASNAMLNVGEVTRTKGGVVLKVVRESSKDEYLQSRLIGDRAYPLPSEFQFFYEIASD